MAVPHHYALVSKARQFSAFSTDHLEEELVPPNTFWFVVVDAGQVNICLANLILPVWIKIHILSFDATI